MTDRPTINVFNPTGARFVVREDEEHRFMYCTVYRWDPPGGYNRVALCYGMQGIDARTQARALAAHYEATYPLPVDTTEPSGDASDPVEVECPNPHCDSECNVCMGHGFILSMVKRS